MKSIKRYGSAPAALPITADDILEFHAARLLLLFRICGTKNRIDGLTKMAKMDFFVRYPQFFNRVSAHARNSTFATPIGIESSMVRHHYGPWDRRYYHVLAYLEGTRLIVVNKSSATFQFELTPSGHQVAESLKQEVEFVPLINQMKLVKKEFGRKTGSSLKKLIYEVFVEEITNKPLGEVIS